MTPYIPHKRAQHARRKAHFASSPNACATWRGRPATHRDRKAVANKNLCRKKVTAP
jgi:hypothetical protein